MKNQTTGRIGKERYLELEQLIAKGHTAVEIGAALGVNPETIRKYARKRRLSIRPIDMSMDKHPCWRNGTVLDRSGYELQRTSIDGEYGYLIRALGRGRTSGYAPTHRIVMHQKLGRPLQPGEVVDHIDGNRLNNDPANLRVFASNSDHLRSTLKGRRPNWTRDGWARMQFGRPRLHPERASNRDQSKIDDPM